MLFCYTNKAMKISQKNKQILIKAIGYSHIAEAVILIVSFLAVMLMRDFESMGYGWLAGMTGLLTFVAQLIISYYFLRKVSWTYGAMLAIALGLGVIVPASILLSMPREGSSIFLDYGYAFYHLVTLVGLILVWDVYVKKK